MRADNKVVHVEMEEERDPQFETMRRRSCTKEVNKLVMRCFHQYDPSRRWYQKQMIVIWREVGTFK